MSTSDRRRRPVRCWLCGKRARRVPGPQGLDPRVLTFDGRVLVVGRTRTLQPYGVCGGKTSWGGTCDQPMLIPLDARFVLEAAIEHDRAGGNTVSEYDL